MALSQGRLRQTYDDCGMDRVDAPIVAALTIALLWAFFCTLRWRRARVSRLERLNQRSLGDVRGISRGLVPFPAAIHQRLAKIGQPLSKRHCD